MAKKIKGKGQDSDTSPTNIRVKYNYLKSLGYRSVHADGFFGGVTPRGLIHLTAFGERGPIPKATVNEVTGTLGDGPLIVGNEVEREGLDGIIRDVEVGIYFDLKVAHALKAWLEEKIEQLEGLNERDA